MTQTKSLSAVQMLKTASHKKELLEKSSANLDVEASELRSSIDANLNAQARGAADYKDRDADAKKLADIERRLADIASELAIIDADVGGELAQQAAKEELGEIEKELIAAGEVCLDKAESFRSHVAAAKKALAEHATAYEAWREILKTKWNVAFGIAYPDERRRGEDSLTTKGRLPYLIDQFRSEAAQTRLDPRITSG